MKKILFVTNLPSPYRVDFFNELSKYCDLYVVFERGNATDRDDNWSNHLEYKFKSVFLNCFKVGVDKSIGFKVQRYIKRNSFDEIVFCGYSSPSVIFAISYCKRKKIPFFLESDGGLFKIEKGIKKLLKKHLIENSKGIFITCQDEIEYFKQYDYPQNKIYKYPFTSINEKDLFLASRLRCNKNAYRSKLNLTEKEIVISIGRFAYKNGYGKGFDKLVLLAELLGDDYGFYLIGDEPTEEFINLKKEKNLTNLHFVGFLKKQELYEYYAASDLSILLSRGDVWGLAINESMMFSLPVIASNKCGAAFELIQSGKNGFIEDIDNIETISKHILYILKNNNIKQKLGSSSFQIIKGYTIEEMVKAHAKVLI